MNHGRLGGVLVGICLAMSLPSIAGPYAAMATQVKAKGGVITVVAAGGLESQSASALDATALGMCHTITSEGVTVTAVQIVTASGQVIRLVSGALIKGC
jgi:hypothetical protein